MHLPRQFLLRRGIAEIVVGHRCHRIGEEAHHIRRGWIAWDSHRHLVEARPAMYLRCISHAVSRVLVYLSLHTCAVSRFGPRHVDVHLTLLNLIPRSKDKFVVALLNQIIRMKDILIEFQLSSMIQHFYMLRELFRARYKGSRACRTTLLRCFRHLVQLREHLFIFTQRKIIVLRRLPKLKRGRFKALSEERVNYKAAPPRQLTLDSPPLIMNLVILRMGTVKAASDRFLFFLPAKT